MDRGDPLADIKMCNHAVRINSPLHPLRDRGKAVGALR